MYFKRLFVFKGRLLTIERSRSWGYRLIACTPLVLKRSPEFGRCASCSFRYCRLYLKDGGIAVWRKRLPCLWRRLHDTLLLQPKQRSPLMLTTGVAAWGGFMFRLYIKRLSLLVRETGLEPVWINRWILSPVRLPIPPLSRSELAYHKARRVARRAERSWGNKIPAGPHGRPA